MANFKSNHSKKTNFGRGVSKILVYIVMIVALYFGFDFFKPNNESQAPETKTAQNDDFNIPVIKDFDFIPEGKAKVFHSYYALSYNEKFEQANWVAYPLTRASLRVPNVPRSDDFRWDNQVDTRSASREDYKRSGYDRGHMVPAGDMAFNETAMSETFFMSNMSPQVHAFNGGVWRELEEQVRDWAKSNDEIYVVTGPVLTQKPLDWIGENNVAVPKAYYKVILDYKKPELKAIGFVLPNKMSEKPLREYAMPVDRVEEITGIDFFPNLMSKEEEAVIEKNIDLKKWRMSKKRYNQRLRSWNKHRNH